MGSGFKTFTAGSILTASDVQNYLQDQAVMVFGGTAARSSAIGTANFEEGMLTYLTDVDKLQVYTGASFVDVYPAASSNQGLTLINTTSFSAVSSFSFPNDTFTSTYDNYVLIMKFLTSSNVPTVSWRGRIAGTDTTATNYNQQNVYFDSTATTSVRSSSQSSGSICFPGNPGIGSTSYIYGPKLTEGTGVVTNAVNYITNDSILSSFYVSAYDLTTAFDSMTILVSTGTMTGNASMFGVAK